MSAGCTAKVCLGETAISCFPLFGTRADGGCEWRAITPGFVPANDLM